MLFVDNAPGSRSRLVSQSEAFPKLDRYKIARSAESPGLQYPLVGITNGTPMRVLKIASYFLAIASAGTVQARAAQMPVSPPAALAPAGVPDWQTAAGGKMEFEVASVRPSAPGTGYESNISLVGDGRWKGNFFRADAIFMVYISFAYKITDPVRGRAIWDSLPPWAKSTFFHIQARAAGSPNRDQVRLMMQSLLADRFQLAVRREMQRRDAFALLLNKPGTLGPTLKEHEADHACDRDPNRPPVIPEPSPGTHPPRYCGVVTWHGNGETHVQIVNATMAEIANDLSGEAMQGGIDTPHAGFDNTGLAGQFDLDLDFTPANDLDQGGLPFMAALQKQAGLKLVERKAPVEVLVVEHVQPPSAE